MALLFYHCLVALLLCHYFAKEDFNTPKHLNTKGHKVLLGFCFFLTNYILHSITVLKFQVFCCIKVLLEKISYVILLHIEMLL